MKKGISLVCLVMAIVGMISTTYSVNGLTNFSGTVESEYGDPISGITIILADCYFNILGFTTTDGDGDYSLSLTLNGNSPYYLTATKDYRWDTDMEIVFSGGAYDFELDAITEKIAVFFYVTDACHPDTIVDYIDILEVEGYTKFFKFENSLNVASECQTVDNYERDVDTVFVYVIGHGLNNGSHSYIDFKAGEGTYNVYSNTFRSYMDAWESPRKCLLVDSCYSGDWADDFAASPYLAMSTSDETHESKYYTPNIEGKFSHWFFDAIYNDYTAVNAFYSASGYCTNPVQNPKIRDYSTYVWFN